MWFMWAEIILKPNLDQVLQKEKYLYAFNLYTHCITNQYLQPTHHTNIVEK